MTVIGHSVRTNAIVENIRARHGRDGKDGETQIIVQTDDAAVDALKKEIAALKAQQLEPRNDIDPVPRALGEIISDQDQIKQDLDAVRKEVASHLADIHRRILELEQQPINITPAEPAELQDNINELGRELADMSASILQHIVTLQKRADAQDARFAELPVLLGQLRKERRAG